MSFFNTILTRLGLRKGGWNHPMFHQPPSGREGIQEGLITAVAIKAGISAQQVDAEREFAQFGFDSLSLVAFTSKLEDWLRIKLEPTTMWDYPTIVSLTDHLVGEMGMARESRAG